MRRHSEQCQCNQCQRCVGAVLIRFQNLFYVLVHLFHLLEYWGRQGTVVVRRDKCLIQQIRVYPEIYVTTKKPTLEQALLEAYALDYFHALQWYFMVQGWITVLL